MDVFCSRFFHTTLITITSFHVRLVFAETCPATVKPVFSLRLSPAANSDTLFPFKTQVRKKNDPMEDGREAAPSLIGFCPVLELGGLC